MRAGCVDASRMRGLYFDARALIITEIRGVVGGMLWHCG